MVDRRLFGLRIHLSEHQRIQRAPDFEIPFQTRKLLASRDFFCHDSGMITVSVLIDLPVLFPILQIVIPLIIRAQFNIRLDGIEGILACAVHRFIDVLGQLVHRLGKLLGDVRAFFRLDQQDVIAVLIASLGRLANDVFRVRLEILIDRHAARVIGICKHLADALEVLRVVRLHLMLAALAEDDNVRAYARTGFTERTGRQLVCRHHVGLLADVVAHPRAVLAIRERTLRGDIHHEAAGAHLVHAVSEEVVVDFVARDAEVRVERDIGNREVVEIICELCFLESRMLDECARVEHTRHTRGQVIDFDAAQTRFLHHVARHTAEEVADAHRGIEHAPARKAQTRNAFPYGPDDSRRGIKGVVHCALRGLVLFRCESRAQLLIHFCIEERILEAAPAVVVSEDGLLFRRRHTPARL